MLTSEFSEMCYQYSGFQVWEIENIDTFFSGNEILATCFKDYYKIPFEDFKEKRSEIVDTDYQIITKLLGMVDDKYFFIFTLHDENHMELVKMQQLKIMDFGVDIKNIKGDKVYVMIMDKNK
jgi:hypothetical protein